MPTLRGRECQLKGAGTYAGVCGWTCKYVYVQYAKLLAGVAWVVKKASRMVLDPATPRARTGIGPRADNGRLRRYTPFYAVTCPTVPTFTCCISRRHYLSGGFYGLFALRGLELRRLFVRSRSLVSLRRDLSWIHPQLLWQLHENTSLSMLRWSFHPDTLRSLDQLLVARRDTDV